MTFRKLKGDAAPGDKQIVSSIKDEKWLPYYLTDEQINDGWEVYPRYIKGMLSHVRYKHNGEESDPAPGVAAIQRWHGNGLLYEVRYAYQGTQRDPAPDEPAYQSYDSNGDRLEIMYLDKNGKLHDPAQDVDALQKYKSGKLLWSSSYEHGKLVRRIPKG